MTRLAAGYRFGAKNAAKDNANTAKHIVDSSNYCNFAAIYRRTPEGMKLTEPGVDDAQHAILQRIAWETVSNYRYSGVEKK